MQSVSTVIDMHTCWLTVVKNSC